MNTNELESLVDCFIKSEHLTITRYYDTGEKESTINYRCGEAHGLCKRFWKNGEPMSIQHLSQGKKHGREQWYYESGRIRCDIMFDYGNIVSGKYYKENGEEIQHF